MSQANMLFHAVHNGDAREVQRLLSQGADVNYQGPVGGGKSVLMVAASQGNAAMVEQLLGSPGVQVDLACQDGTDETALYTACQRGHAEVVRKLLQAGASATATVKAAFGDSHTPLWAAAAMGHAAVVAQLLRQPGVQVDAANRGGATPLAIAAFGGHWETIHLLLAAGANPTAGTRSAICEAARKGAAEVVRALLLKGARANSVDHAGSPALLLAAGAGHTAVVEALLRGPGVQVDAADRVTGATALYVACQEGHLEVVRKQLQAGASASVAPQAAQTPLWMAAAQGHAAVVAELLRQPGVQVDAANQAGATPLNIATQGGHQEVIRLLLAARATTTGGSRAPIFMAAQLGQVEVVRALLRKGARVNEVDHDGGTALLHAAGQGHAAVVAELLRQPGVQVDAANRDGSSPVHIAAQNGRTAILRNLLSAGAAVNFTSQNGTTPLHLAAQTV